MHSKSVKRFVVSVGVESGGGANGMTALEYGCQQIQFEAVLAHSSKSKALLTV